MSIDRTAPSTAGPRRRRSERGHRSARGHRFARGRRFARIGRVVPIAVVQVLGTVLASRWAVGPGGPPWVRHTGVASPDPTALTPLVLGPVALGLLVAGVVVLVVRWRWPVAVLGVVLLTTVAFALVTTPRGPFVAALTMALVNAWFRGHRVPVFVAAGVAQVVLPLADTSTGRAEFPDLTAELLCLAWLTATIAITELARTRIVRAAEARRARAEAERRRAEDERVRIARELHDSVAHGMSLINLQAGVALHLGTELPPATRESLAAIRDTSRDALVELRTILGVLRAVDGAGGAGGGGRSERDPVPGLDRVPDLVDRARAAGLAVDVRVTGDLARVPTPVDRSAFRIVQESITNVARHAPRNPARVRIVVGADALEIVVEDAPSARTDPVGGAPDGGAPDDGAPLGGAVFRAGDLVSGLGGGGNGLVGMRERAAAVGGVVSAGPSAADGWRVTARLPFDAAAPAGPPIPTTSTNEERP